MCSNELANRRDEFWPANGGAITGVRRTVDDDELQ